MKAAPPWVMVLFVLSLALNLWFAGVPDWRWIPAALTAWYLADLLSGLTHMYMDYRPCTPGIGLDRVFHYAGSRESAEYIAMRLRTHTCARWLVRSFCPIAATDAGEDTLACASW